MNIKGLVETYSKKIQYFEIKCQYCCDALDMEIVDEEYEPEEIAILIVRDEEWHKIYIDVKTIAFACPECWEEKVPKAVKEKSIYEFEQKQITRAAQHEMPFCKEVTI